MLHTRRPPFLWAPSADPLSWASLLSSRVIKDFIFSIVSLDNNLSSADEAAQWKNCYDKLPVVIIFDFAIKNFHSMTLPLLLMAIISPACHDSSRFWHKTGSLYDKKPFSRGIFWRARFVRVLERYQSMLICHTYDTSQADRTTSVQRGETALIRLSSHNANMFVQKI